METIKEAKVILRSNFETGMKCPCCNQIVRLYKRPILSAFAKGLVTLVYLQETRRSPIHVSEIVSHSKLPASQGKHFSVLKHWGLIEEMVNYKTNKRTSGYWLATDLGVKFVKGECTVPKYKMTYNAKCYGTSNEQTTISECLKTHFDYKEFIGF